MGGGEGVLAHHWCVGSAQPDATRSGSPGREPSALGSERYSQAALLVLM